MHSGLIWFNCSTSLCASSSRFSGLFLKQILLSFLSFSIEINPTLGDCLAQTSSERRKQGFDAVSLQNNLFHSRPVGCRWNVCLNNWRERGRRQMENLLHRILNTKLPSGKQKKRLINYFRWQIMYFSSLSGTERFQHCQY